MFCSLVERMIWGGRVGDMFYMIKFLLYKYEDVSLDFCIYIKSGVWWYIIIKYSIGGDRDKWIFGVYWLFCLVKFVSFRFS